MIFKVEVDWNNLDEEGLARLTEEISRELIAKAAECKSSGAHRDPIYFGYIATGRSSYRDTVSGICRNCFTGLKRGLNEEEAQQITDLRWYMQQPITI